MPLHGKYDVKLGQSFMEPPQHSFMSMRCDFLPASVDRNQVGTIKISNDKEVGLRLPNVSGAEPSSTLFKGNIRPISKECLLIYNKNTGEMILERISKAAQLKKTRDCPINRKPENITQPPLSEQPSRRKLTKTRTISESSSDGVDEPVVLPVPQPNVQKQRSSPPKPQQPPVPAKHSTLSSSDDSDVNLDIPVKVSGVRGNVGVGNTRPASPGSSSLSSLSSLEDEPKEMPSSSSMTKTQQSKPQLSPTTQRRTLMENDLHLTDSDSEDDS